MTFTTNRFGCFIQPFSRIRGLRRCAHHTDYKTFIQNQFYFYEFSRIFIFCRNLLGIHAWICSRFHRVPRRTHPEIYFMSFPKNSREHFPRISQEISLEIPLGFSLRTFPESISMNISRNSLGNFLKSLQRLPRGWMYLQRFVQKTFGSFCKKIFEDFSRKKLTKPFRNIS